MRILIKGGVWKNTEDEILKAAVMKYGLNQWARISSLLVRKSAKQCKARWYEWLDPAIKKTEWSREEEEKLLHLAKLMPTQWRTIAPIVGRTPAQCLEHYEKLLDAAQSSAMGEGESLDPADDPRRLRPGEIDPTPEAKPARPDPVDMDEDEKEMLSEARARLANTRGKKAKRKAREKQLDEARRLASLQKRRELKAAGLDLPQRKRKLKGIDYAKEMPFPKQIPKGFYDSSSELDRERAARDSPDFINVTLQRLEAKRRDDEEDRRRRQDAQRHNKQKREDLPSYIQQINKINDPAQMKQRPRMKLPDAQITDTELEEMAKLGYTPEDLAVAGVGGSDGGVAEGGVTKALLSNYGRGPTPFRVPASKAGGAAIAGRTPARQDTVLMEAQNLAALTVARTPLLGEQNSQLHSTFSDFGGVTPARTDVQTPNPLATPAHKSGLIAGSQTPLLHGASGSRALATPGGNRTPAMGSQTPLRDGLSINSADQALAGVSGDPSQQQLVLDPRLERQRAMMLQANLKLGLQSLPEPSNDYKFVIPAVPEEDEDMNGLKSANGREEDAADTERRRLAVEKAREAKKLRMRSQVLRKELPRPLGLTESFISGENPAETSAKSDYNSVVEDELRKAMTVEMLVAEQEVKNEMTKLLGNDAFEYPIKGVNPPKTKPVMDELTEEELLAARDALQAEAGTLGAEDLRGLVAGLEEESSNSEWLFVPSKKTFVRYPATAAQAKTVAAEPDLLEALQYRFKQLFEWNKNESARAAALEKKVGLYHGGYESRASALSNTLSQPPQQQQQQPSLHAQLDQASLELACFESLQIAERQAVRERGAKVEREVEVQRVREATLQARYAGLVQERERLLQVAAINSSLALL
eukprot:TRINITY_DN3616_c0_g1_i2.p1 TRINITY_DN3616_c0_g1~~TRINITY_DN3616_c0_g1_i2.p1  ORF type:complete len:872 (-),score=208.35 TRINITY_DN3616_c0_g1_i2:60-2675(-)